MSPRLVAAMAAVLSLGGSAGPAAQSDPPLRSGIFFEDPAGKIVALPSNISQDVETHGVGKSMLTQGFSKPTITVRHGGATADVVVAESQPAFLFRFADMSRMQQDPMAMIDAMQGGGGLLQGKNPKDYVLARLKVDGDARVASSKGMQTFKFESRQKGAREFEVRVLQPLDAGEYAFFQTSTGAPAQIWAFSVRK